MQRNVGGGLASGSDGGVPKGTSSPTKNSEGIKNKRVFIENTTDSIL